MNRITGYSKGVLCFLLVVGVMQFFAPVSQAATEREQLLENQVKQLLERVEQLEGRLGVVEKKEVSPAAPAENPKSINWEWNNGLSFATKDGSGKFKLGGRIQNDWMAGSIDDGNFSDGTRFRRVWLNFSGSYLDDYFFKIQYDISGAGTARFKDVYVGYSGLDFMDIQVGQFKEPFSLEELTSSNYMSFMERSPLNTLSPSRETGVMFSNEILDDRMTWAVGAFKNANDFGDANEDDIENGDWDVTGRITGLPWYEDKGEKLLHLGLAGSHREWSDEPMRIRSRGSFSVGDRLVDTGTFDADSLNLVGVEAALVYGPASLQAEYTYADVEPTVGGAESINSFYVEGTYFLTGEHRAYKGGVFSRVKPKKNFSLKDGGYGAWQVGLRYTYLDLDEIAFANAGGGQLDDFTFGVNWYLNPNVRVMWNYVHSENDLRGGNDQDADAFMMRLQYDF